MSPNCGIARYQNNRVYNGFGLKQITIAGGFRTKIQDMEFVFLKANGLEKSTRLLPPPPPPPPTWEKKIDASIAISRALQTYSYLLRPGTHFVALSWRLSTVSSLLM